jgi:hypothetical protein
MEEKKDARPAWHIIVPFYFGTNRWVTRKGGTPKRKKISYLKRTIESLNACIENPDIIIAVCNEKSAEMARTVYPNVKQIECPSKHLTYAPIIAVVKEWGISWPDSDIIMYNEDDQELFMSRSVADDIANHGNRFIFAPHRWERAFWLKEILHPHPLYHFFKKQRGVITNVNNNQSNETIHSFNHSYTEQKSWGAAFAACWAMQMGVLRSLDLSVPQELIALETSTQVVFSRNYPSLKLNLTDNDFTHFVVNHLSGYDFHRRIIYLGKLFPAKKEPSSKKNK